MLGLYDIEKSDQAPFETQTVLALTPALVIVHSERWMEYGAMIDLENPQLSSPFIFAWSISPVTDASLANDFPDRTVYHYYPERVFQLYRTPLMNP
jgi:hypothetical protein